MTHAIRQFNVIDKLCLSLDQTLRTLSHNPQTTSRQNPATAVRDTSLKDKERKHSAGLMRVNHAGEVCAQALYQGQALTARTDQVRAHMHQASLEENDHLAWCQKRLQELGSHTSFLSPLWYFGSLGIGITAGLVGDKWSLGFLSETEHQVTRHLEGHLKKLPENDHKSRVILDQMIIDERNHEKTALQAGAKDLPKTIKALMGLTSTCMTTIAYWI